MTLSIMTHLVPVRVVSCPLVKFLAVFMIKFTIFHPLQMIS